MERPSASSVQHVSKNTEEKLKPDENELDKIKRLKTKIIDSNKIEVKHLHKKRKAKGPNPLSCKKKVAKQNPNNKKISNK